MSVSRTTEAFYLFTVTHSEWAVVAPDTPEFALEYIVLMSLLAKRLEGARRRAPKGTR